MELTLREVLTKERFEAIQSLFSSRYGLMLESITPDGKGIWGLSQWPCYPAFCGLIRKSRSAAARCNHDRRQWLDLARTSKKPYIGVCHAGVLFGCVAAVYRGKSLGGMIFGKCLADRPGSLSPQDLRGRFKGLRFYWNVLSDAMRQIDVVSQGRMIRGGTFLQSQFSPILMPQHMAAMRKRKARMLTQKQRRRERLNRPIPRIAPASRIGPVMEFMTYHYDLRLKLADLARSAGMSVFGFAHLFRKEIGMTPVDYLTQVRIGHAKRMLATTDCDCREIMESIGYTHQSYYIRVFKRVTGMTPEQFRLRKNTASGAARSAKKRL